MPKARGGKRGLTATGFWGDDGNVTALVVMVTQPYTYIKIQPNIHFKLVNFMYVIYTSIKLL